MVMNIVLLINSESGTESAFVNFLLSFPLPLNLSFFLQSSLLVKIILWSFFKFASCSPDIAIAYFGLKIHDSDKDQLLEWAVDLGSPGYSSNVSGMLNPAKAKQPVDMARGRNKKIKKKEKLKSNK